MIAICSGIVSLWGCQKNQPQHPKNHGASLTFGYRHPHVHRLLFIWLVLWFVEGDTHKQHGRMRMWVPHRQACGTVYDRSEEEGQKEENEGASRERLAHKWAVARGGCPVEA